MYQNQIENEQRAFHIPVAQRVDGLNGHLFLLWV